MKKILIISQYFQPEIGSGPFRIKSIYDLLIRKYNVDVLTKIPSYPSKGLYNDYVEENKNIYRVQSKLEGSSLLVYLSFFYRGAIFLILSKKKYDIVIVSSPPIFVMLLGLIAKIKFKSKLILDIRDLWPDSIIAVGKTKSKLILLPLYILEKFTYWRANIIIYNSRGFEKHLSKYVKKSYYLPNGFNNEELKTRRALFYNKKQNDKFIIFYSGNAGLAQNLKPLLEIAKKMKNKSNIIIRLYIFGKEVNKIKKIIKDENIKNVEIRKPIKRDELIKKIVNYNLGFFCLKNSTVFETVLPGKILDYLSLGIPIFGVGKGHVKNVSKNFYSFDVFNENDIDEMVTLITDYINCVKKNNVYKYEKNFEKLTKEFSLEENINKIIKEIR